MTVSSGNAPLRLLHVVPTYLPAVRYGGPIQSVHALCRALAAQGHVTDVFTTNVDGPGDSDVPLERPVDLEGVQITYFPSKRLRRSQPSNRPRSRLLRPSPRRRLSSAKSRPSAMSRPKILLRSSTPRPKAS